MAKATKAAAAGKPAAGKPAAKKKSFKKREKKNVPVGVAHIQASFNNTLVTIAAPDGKVVSWSSSGSLGFRGSRKGTPYAAGQAALRAATGARDQGMRSLDVRITGPGSGRETAVRSLATAGLEVRSIKDVTPIPHNGCRPAKRRRV
ncbi:MAG TPA: 30S ribosomal protein S11 [Terriglobales bacterium]|jgi:small subunit ribosomal protein S11